MQCPGPPSLLALLALLVLPVPPLLYVYPEEVTQPPFSLARGLR